MNTVITEAEKIEEPTLENLRAIADLAEKRLQKFTASLVDSRARREKLVMERGSLVVPARVEKNTAAQKRLLAIDEQLVALNRDIKDDETVLSDLTEKLAFAHQNLERAEWEAKREEVRARLVSRIASGVDLQIEKAARQLASLLLSTAAQDEELSMALLRFDRHLRTEGGAIAKSGDMRARFVGLHLSKAAQNIIDTRSVMPQFLDGRTAEEINRIVYQNAVKALDDLELIF